MFFLNHCCPRCFPCWELQSTSPPQDDLKHCADLQTCFRGSSDSNVVPLLCVFASSVHSYQNQCIFFCGSSQCAFIYSIDTESAQLIVWIQSAACTAGGKVLGLLPQPHCPWVSIVVLFPPLHVGHPLEFAPEAALEDLGLPL